MADERKKVVQPPYICGWCAIKLHDRYQKHIYNDNSGNQYCSSYCRDMAIEANKGDWIKLKLCSFYDDECEDYDMDAPACYLDDMEEGEYCPILGRDTSLKLRNVPSEKGE
jgi:hypothetical protein